MAQESSVSLDSTPKVMPPDGRARIRDFKGLIPTSARLMRRITFVLLVTLILGLTFMQFGFFGIGRSGVHVAYVMVLLAPIVVGALLLGRAWGCATGLAAGIIQGLHAVIQPLDLYEMYFISPVTAVILYVMVGLLAGFAIQVALRNNPTGVRRLVYSVVVCVLVSFFATILLLASTFVNVIFALASDAVMQAASGAETLRAIDPSVLRAVSGIGDPVLQVVLDALLMWLVSWGTDVAYTRLKASRCNRSLRTTFRGWLLFVAGLAVMLVSSFGFVVITGQAMATAHEKMDAQIEYLSSQISHKVSHAAQMTTDEAIMALPQDSLDVVRSAFELQGLLDGYDLGYDGTVVVFGKGESDGESMQVLLSDNPAYPVGSTAEDAFGSLGDERLEALAETHEMMQTVYDVELVFTVNAEGESALELSDHDGSAFEPAQIGYMCVGEVDGYYVMMALPASMVFAERSDTARWVSVTVLVLLGVVFLFVWRLLGSIVVKPIDETNSSLAKITSGDLDEQVSVRDSREFASLSDGINATVGALRNWISEAERGMERELVTAKTIQSSALPSTFPPFPEIEDFDIYASMNAAKEVGGDFYDFFLIDDHTLGFLIADVSGKGVPGALFMMAAKAELQNFMATGMSIDQAVLGANAHLCQGNDAGMFVTVWAATLDYKTGELTYVNAGHNPPLLRHGSGGQWEWLSKRGGLFLGTFDMAKYRSTRLTLAPGDELLLYTDGVNEAFNVNEEEYGNDRLEEFVAHHNDLHPRAMVSSLRADVAEWAKGAEQSDDITIVCLEYGVAPEVTGTLTLPAVLDNLGRAMGLVDSELDKRLCPPSVRNRIDVAFEELFVNVCNYAYAGQDEPGSVRVSYRYTGDPSSMTVEIVDQGVPFDPVTREDPTVPSNIQEAKIGGLGIMMAKRCVDDLSYVRDGDNNVVVFTKSW